MFLPIVSHRNWKDPWKISGSDWGREAVREFELEYKRVWEHNEPFKRRGSCDKCRKKVLKGAGTFYGNFCIGRGQYSPYQMMWCGGCYVEHKKYDSPKFGKYSGGDWKGYLEGIYKKGRTGYHMITDFQCNLCHFQNMKKRDPTDMSQEYEGLIIAIRWA